MTAKIFKSLIILLFTGVSFSTQASDFYIAVSASSNSIDDPISSQAFLPTPTITAAPSIGGVSPTLSFDDIFGIINGMQNTVLFTGPFVLVPSTVASDNNQTGYMLSLGYHLLENLDVEISYADLGAYSTTPKQVFESGMSPGFTINNTIFITPELEIEQLAIRARYRHALSNNFSLLGSAGVINTSVDAEFSTVSMTSSVQPEEQIVFPKFSGSTEGTGAQLGAGVSWQLPQGFQVNLSYFRHFADTADLDSILLTLEYDL